MCTECVRIKEHLSEGLLSVTLKTQAPPGRLSEDYVGAESVHVHTQSGLVPAGAAEVLCI